MSLICCTACVHFADGVLEAALPEALRRRRVGAALMLADAGGLAGSALSRLTGPWPDGTGWRLAGLDACGRLPGQMTAATRAGQLFDAILGFGGPAALAPEALHLSGAPDPGAAAARAVAAMAAPGPLPPVSRWRSARGRRISIVPSRPMRRC